MVLGRLFEPLLPGRITRVIVASLGLTVAVHYIFNLDVSRSINVFIAFASGFFGVAGGSELFLVLSGSAISIASANPMIFVIMAAAISFFFLDPFSKRGEFFSSLSFALRIVIVTVLAYVSALVIGPEVVDFVMGGING